MSVDNNQYDAIGTDNTEPEKLIEWVEKYDETYNLYYYTNSITGECQWDSPFENPCGDEAQQQSRNEPEMHADYADINGDDFENLAQSNHTDGHFPFEEDDIALEDRPNTERLSDYSDAWKEYYANEGHPVYYEEEEYANSNVAYGYSGQKSYKVEGDYDSDEAADEYNYDQDCDGDGEHSAEPYDEESAPPAVKNRSKDLLVGGSNQDYVHMARMYKLTRPYSDPAYAGLCVLCHTNFADMVYFPCEHRCVCYECIRKENICRDVEMESVRDGYCNCSLCAGIIKLILPSENGAEVAKYWNWVYEESIPLPPNFLRNFRHSAGVIRAVHVRTGDANKVDSFENASKSCVIA